MGCRLSVRSTIRSSEPCSKPVLSRGISGSDISTAEWLPLDYRYIRARSGARAVRDLAHDRRTQLIRSPLPKRAVRGARLPRLGRSAAGIDVIVGMTGERRQWAFVRATERSNCTRLRRV